MGTGNAMFILFCKSQQKNGGSNDITSGKSLNNSYRMNSISWREFRSNSAGKWVVVSRQIMPLDFFARIRISVKLRNS